MEKLFEEFFDFATLISALKTIERYKGMFYWRDYPQLARDESVADHSWRVAMLVLLFEKKLSQKIDVQKALTMAVVHDLAEVLTGDMSPLGEDGTGKTTYAYDKNLKRQKFEKEKEAARNLFDKLPGEIGNKLFAVWLECEERESYEAKVVKALDRIEAGLTIWELRRGHMFKAHLEFTVGYIMRGVTDSDEVVEKFGEYVCEKMRREWREYKAKAS